MNATEQLKRKIDKAHPMILQFLTQMVEDQELNDLLKINQSRDYSITLFGRAGKKKPSKRPRINFY